MLAPSTTRDAHACTRVLLNHLRHTLALATTRDRPPPPPQVGQLPGFQAAVPSALKYMVGDTNMTDNGEVLPA